MGIFFIIKKTLDSAQHFICWNSHTPILKIILTSDNSSTNKFFRDTYYNSKIEITFIIENIKAKFVYIFFVLQIFHKYIINH